MDLVRIGVRVVLLFVFVFFRRVWRLGEDVDLCRELFEEVLEVF